jgi:uncharacterized protein YqeY
MLKATLQKDQIKAMKSGDKNRRQVIRLMMSAIKQIEIDSRKELSDDDVIAVLGKMLKQRRDSHTQYTDAGRNDLAEQEAFEITIINEYLPEALSDDEVAAIIDEIIASTGAASPKDMGRVMGQLKARLQGRADMGSASALVKQKLSA